MLQQVKGASTVAVDLATHGFGGVLSDVSIKDFVTARVNFTPVHGFVAVSVSRANRNLAVNVENVVANNHQFAVFFGDQAFDFIPCPGGGNGDVLLEFGQLLLGVGELTHRLVVGDGGDVALDD